jgi:hypothetical protein
MFQRAWRVSAGLLLLFLLAIAAFLAAIPGPRRPLQYMVAGSAATAVTIAAAFGALYRLHGRSAGSPPLVRIRIARRSGQSS